MIGRPVSKFLNLVLDLKLQALQLVYSRVIGVGVLHFRHQHALKLLVPLIE